MTIYTTVSNVKGAVTPTTGILPAIGSYTAQHSSTTIVRSMHQLMCELCHKIRQAKGNFSLTQPRTLLSHHPMHHANAQAFFLVCMAELMQMKWQPHGNVKRC